MAAFHPRLMSLLALVVVLLLPMRSEGIVEDKCAACKAVAMELEMALANEKPKKDIDLRYRLDSTGQRVGRVVEYKFSELRALELLEDLCTKMKEYTYHMYSGRWMKPSPMNKRSDEDKREDEAHSKDITVYCGRLLEKYEDELTSRIRSGEMVLGSVEKVFCTTVVGDCEASLEGDKEL